MIAQGETPPQILMQRMQTEGFFQQVVNPLSKQSILERINRIYGTGDRNSRHQSPFKGS